MTRTTKSDTKELKYTKKALDHWDRMIKWAKKQPPTNEPNFDLMKQTIGEGWGTQDCDLCNIHKTTCTKCAIWVATGKHCTSQGHDDADFSLTWSQWIEGANQLRKTLLKTIEYYEKRLSDSD